MHKTYWRILAWRLQWGELKLVDAVDDIILMNNGRGAFMVIDFKPPDQPNEGLEY